MSASETRFTDVSEMRPEPLLPPEVDLRGLPFMPLDVLRLRDSDLAATATGEEFRAAVILWCASWHQEPAASLPNDDRSLAHLAGFGRDLTGWREVKAQALRGWVECSDGRLYHPVVAEKALEVWAERVEYRGRRAKDRQRLSDWRDRKRDRRDASTPAPLEASSDGNATQAVSETPVKRVSMACRNGEETSKTGTGTGTTTTPLPPRTTTPADGVGSTAGGGGGQREAERIAEAVHEAVGVDHRTHANWHQTAVIVARCLGQGCTEDDILGAARDTKAAMAAGTRVGGPKYLEPIALRWRDDRIRPPRQPRTRGDLSPTIADVDPEWMALRKRAIRDGDTETAGEAKRLFDEKGADAANAWARERSARPAAAERRIA